VVSSLQVLQLEVFVLIFIKILQNGFKMLCAFLTCPMRDTYPVNLTVLYLITLIILGETVQIMKYIMMQILYTLLLFHCSWAEVFCSPKFNEL